MPSTLVMFCSVSRPGVPASAALVTRRAALMTDRLTPAWARCADLRRSDSRSRGEDRSRKSRRRTPASSLSSAPSHRLSSTSLKEPSTAICLLSFRHPAAQTSSLIAGNIWPDLRHGSPTRNPSTCLSHPSSRFQPVKMRLAPGRDPRSTLARARVDSCEQSANKCAPKQEVAADNQPDHQAGREQSVNNFIPNTR